MKIMMSAAAALALSLSLSQAMAAEAPPPSDMDPLERSYPKVHATRDGAPAEWPEVVHDSPSYPSVIVDRLEYGDSDKGDNKLWDIQGWYGNDTHRLWLKTEGEGATGEAVEALEVQALYSRPLSPFWDWQAGVRYDARPNPDQTFGVLALQGLAPYWFETSTSLFVGDEGDVRARAEFEYDQLITQRLILQPRLEINAALNDVPQYGLAQGVTDSEAGLRLRYEIVRQFAPYIGVRRENQWGDTKDRARAAGEPTAKTSWVIGVRAWY